jgi:MOSC domain-containing protein YiiM
MATVERIFVTGEGSAPMVSVDEIKAIAGQGLEGDRYLKRTGYYSGWDECQVTLIEGEDLDVVTEKYGVDVTAGQHRRNIVTRGLSLRDVECATFSVGAAVLAYDRPRPPCRYIASITEPGMTKALGARRGGICATVLETGLIRVGDPIEVKERRRSMFGFRR